MSWCEFSYFLEGLSGETPLGRMVSIRAEKDPEKLREFTPDQRMIRNEYLKKQASHKSAKQTDEVLEGLKKTFTGMAK